MKKIFKLLLITLLFASCGNTKTENDEDKNQDIDTIFLGLTFGMNKTEYANRIDSLIAENKLERSHVFGANQYLYKFDFGADKEIARYGFAKLSPVFEDGELWKLHLFIKGENQFDLPVMQFTSLEELYKQKYGKFEYSDTNDFQSTWTFNNMNVVLTMDDDFCIIVYTDLDKLESFENEPADIQDI